MKKLTYYVPLVVRESAKAKALALVDEGYIQAHETIVCPLCSTKYLFLCDHKDSGRAKSTTRQHEQALHYFRDKIRESHLSDHIEDVFVLPYELHMVSSMPGSPDTSGRQAG